MMKTSKILIPATILFLILVIVLADRFIFKVDAQSEKEYRNLSIFSEVAAKVKTNYVEEVDPAEKFPGAFSGMLSFLDSFSSYLDAAKTKTYLGYQSGQYCTCGIYGARARDYFFITDVIPDSPAGRAGLKQGDIIKSVNDTSFYGLSFWEMYFSLISDEPQKLEITLLKENSRDTQKFELQSSFMNIRTTITSLKNDISLIKLTRFDGAAAALLKEKLSAYSNNPLSKNKPLKWIIDLRTYNGGDLESFKQIADLFFKEKIALTLQFKKKQEEIFPDIKEKNVPEYKAVVIINRSTIMYGELLAAIFRNQGAGTAGHRSVTLVGTATQGFIAQLLHVPLEDKSSILLTCGLFHLNGKPLASQKIDPDILIAEKDNARIIDKCISILTLDAASNSGNFTGEKNDNGKKKGKTN